MGSDFLTLEEAANRLGRSIRSVHLYVKSGHLRKERRDGRIVVRREEVEILAHDLLTDAPALNRKSFMELVARVQGLGRDMAVVRKALGIQADPFRPGPEESAALYQSATLELSLRNWDTKKATIWAGVFERLDEVALEKIGEALNNQTPWEVFYRLCLHMLKAVSDQPDFKTNLELQTAHLALDEARKKLRSVIIMWTELGRGTIPVGYLKTLDSAEDSILKAVTAKPQKK